MEHLITLVQNNPVLYDTSHPDYMRANIKDQIWEEIAKELNMENGKKAKDQWTKLKDCHRDALRSQPKAVIRPWNYQKQMEFLIPFSTGDHEVTADETSNNTCMIDTQSTPEFLSTPYTKKKKINLADVLEKNFKKCEERALRRDELKKKKYEDARENDALRLFFISMYNLTKVMPCKYQQQIRKKLFAQSPSVQPSWSSSTSNIGSESAERCPTFFINPTDILHNDQNETRQNTNNEIR